MALSDSWLKANNGKKRPAVQEVKDRDGLSVRISLRIPRQTCHLIQTKGATQSKAKLPPCSDMLKGY